MLLYDPEDDEQLRSVTYLEPERPSPKRRLELEDQVREGVTGANFMLSSPVLWSFWDPQRGELRVFCYVCRRQEAV